jgi:hypothetical protein
LVPTWTQAQALDAVVQETKGLMEEFEEAFWNAADDLVVVDPDQSMSEGQLNSILAIPQRKVTH